MAPPTHDSAPTQFVVANGIRFAYRRFGQRRGIPLLFHMHFVGTMDHWDPVITDGLARGREVILFNNAGISSSGGRVPTTIAEMAANSVAFARALGLEILDVLGFSIGGLVAQEMTLAAPDLVRKLVLVGTGPRSGEGMASLTPEAQAIFGATYSERGALWRTVFFTDSDTSQAAGRQFIKRIELRVLGRDPEADEHVGAAQLQALAKWGAPREQPYAYLRDITQPTLIVNGSKDVIIYTVNSYILQQNLPNAQLVLYPDAGHGSQYQYPDRFVRHVTDFLNESS